jgi:hypothetical protein
MRVLNVKEMESSFEIDLRDVPWWKFIKNIYRLGVPVITRLSKERCIFLVVEGRPSWVACMHD